MRLNALAYYADFFISFALILMLAATALWDSTLVKVAQWGACALAGFTVWTLLEYFVHRVLYHNVPYFVEMHDAHHAEPNAFIGAPPIIGVLLILALFYAPISPFNELAASGFTAGMFAGYMGYMLMHHAAHYWNVRPGTWLYMAASPPRACITTITRKATTASSRRCGTTCSAPTSSAAAAAPRDATQ